MNFNISNTNDYLQFLPVKSVIKLSEGQIWSLSTFFSKNSHFNSFETLIGFLLIVMETSAKLAKKFKTWFQPIWFDFSNLPSRLKLCRT